jgi:hypothetical protein
LARDGITFACESTNDDFGQEICMMNARGNRSRAAAARESALRVLPAAFAALALGFFAASALARQNESLPPASIVAAGARDLAPSAAKSPDPAEVSARPIWKRVTLGAHRNIGSLRNVLEHAGVRIGDSADEILGRPAFSLSRAKTDVDLVVASVAELGFRDGAPLEDIYWRAGELGLELCPAEVAPLLRLQYVDQPLGEFLSVAMRPIATYAGEPTMLSLANAGTGPLLIGGAARPDLMLNAGAKLVFVRPQRIARPDLR